MLGLILRSAHAEVLPQTRTRVRASRRMRTGEGRVPSCFETHRSALGLLKRLRSRPAAMLLSMRAGAGGAFWRTDPTLVLAKTNPTASVRAWAERTTNLRL